MKYAMLCGTAFGAFPKDHRYHERRVQQFSNGFREIAEIVRRFPYYDVYATDNTVQDPADVDPRIMEALESIPTLKGKDLFWDNEFGKINNGSGQVCGWKYILPRLLGKYEYVVNYEPRHHLANYSFFERMESRPDAYFCVYNDRRNLWGIPLTLPRVWTGFFSLRTEDLYAYTCAPDRGVPPQMTPRPWWWSRYRDFRFRYLPGWLERLDECIEADLIKYLRRHRIPIVPVASLGTIWHDQANDLLVEMDNKDRW